jgi:hypothetical protein
MLGLLRGYGGVPSSLATSWDTGIFVSLDQSNQFGGVSALAVLHGIAVFVLVNYCRL